MLTIHLSSSGDTYTFDGDIAALFRTVRVVGERIVFVEVSPGHLINLTEVERIVDETEQHDVSPSFFGVPDDKPATPIPGGPPSCKHGYIEGTCEQCRDESIEAPDDGAQGLR